MVFFRSSPSLNFFNITASGFLLFLIARISFRGKLKNFFIGDYLRIFVLPFWFIPAFLRTVSQVLELRGVFREHEALRQVIRGVFFAIPALFVFIVLFSSADLVFQKYISGIIKIDQETVLRTIFMISATFVFIGAFGYIFQKTAGNSAENDIAGTRRRMNLGAIETSVILGLINGLFFIFIAIQFTYLFGGESSIRAFDFTYSEYARKGFFELMIAAIISFLIVWTAEKDIMKKNEKHILSFKILGVLLVIQVVFIIASAFLRLLIYEEAYGFTIARLYGHAFVIWLAAVFILLIYKILAGQKENPFAFGVFAAVLLFLAGLNLLNPEAFVARKNLERFDRTGMLDVRYLRQLSDDALLQRIKIIDLDSGKEKFQEMFDDLKKNYARELYWSGENRLKQKEQWQKINFSGLRVKKLLRLKMKELEPYKDYAPPQTYFPSDDLKTPPF